MTALQKTLCLAALIVVSAGLLGQQVAGWNDNFNSDSPPRVLLSESEIDLGGVTVGTAPAGFVTVKNGGGQRLIINRERGPCPNCDQESPLIVPPGVKKILPFQLDIQASPGPLLEEIRFQTNDRTTPTFVLRIQGLVGDRILAKAHE